jgi:SAM-dependent methyltransferase
MISDKDLPELENYRRLERSLPIETVPTFGPLVVSGDNDNAAIHRWFKYKEAYSAKLLQSILSHAHVSTSRSPLVLLDPYCGVGTSLLSAQVNPQSISSATGIERNPFVAFVARAKLGWPSVDPNELERIGIAALTAANDSEPTLPELSSIRTGRCITRHIASRLLSIRNSILEFPKSATRDALLVGLAAAIEPLSRVRKDGRALRLVDRSHQHVIPLLRKKWIEIQNDVTCMQAAHKQLVKTEVKNGDGRALSAAQIESDSVDIVLTSPPYPNNIDYSEVYKLELWLLGFVNSSTEFLRLRKSTLRSHPTSDLHSDPETDFLIAIGKEPLVSFFDPVVKRTAAYGETWRNRLALGYFSDLWVSLREQYRCLRPGGRVFLVIGNSLHGCAGKAYLIPTDLMLGQLGKTLGFQLERILIARNTRRRLSGNHFLRESIVALRKPENG